MRWLVSLLLLAVAGAAAAAAPPSAVYGIEHEVRGGRERVLLFAGEAVAPRLEAGERGEVVVVLPHAVLDDSAPRTLRPRGDALVGSVRAEEVVEDGVPAVRVAITAPRADAPELVQRGAVVAVEFLRPERFATGGVQVEFEDAPLSEIVAAIGKATGTTWIHDEGLTGRVTIVAAERVSDEEALALLNAALRLTGNAALPLPGGGHRIAPLANALPLAPYVGSAAAGGGDAPIVTLRRLEAASAEELATALGPWLGTSGLAVPVPSSNALLLAGPESDVHGLLSIVDALDQGARTPLWVRRVRTGDAAQVADLLRESFAGSAPGRGLEVWSDARTGLLVARGAQDVLDEARRRLDRIDRPAEGYATFEVRRLRHADPEEILRILDDLASGGGEGLAPGAFGASVDRASHALVIRAEPAVQARLAEVIAALDLPPPRIHVEATVLEIVASETLALGFDALLPWGGGPGARSGGFALLDPGGGGLVQPGAGRGPAFAARFQREPVSIPIVGPGGQLVSVLVPRESVVLTADDRVIESHVLLRPHLLLVSGEEHEIFAGDEVPIPVSGTASGLAVPSTRVDIQRQNVGVRLKVRPSLGQGGRVRLELDVQASNVRPAATLASGSQGPVIQERHVQTTVLVENDEILLVGMGVLGDVQEREVGTPWLKDVPFFGHAFRRVDTQRVKTHVMVAVQARIQPDTESQVAETIRRRTGFERALARVESLPRGAAPRWALRVATLGRPDDAADVAAHFARLGETVETVPWSWEGRERYDVLLDGFDSLADASRAALRARDEGFAAELVSVPARGD